MRQVFFLYVFLLGCSASLRAQDPACKDVWVATDPKIVLFIPEPGEVVSPILVPVNGASNPNIQWKWTPALGLVTNTGADASTTLRPYFDVTKLGDLGGNKFETTFFIQGKLGACSTFATIDVIILARIKPYDAITPNGDDFNDYWSIDNISAYPEATIVVMDRWGQPVFESTGDIYEEKPFRGYLNDKLLPTGVYMYRIKPNGDYPDVVGSLTIIR